MKLSDGFTKMYYTSFFTFRCARNFSFKKRKKRKRKKERLIYIPPYNM